MRVIFVLDCVPHGCLYLALTWDIFIRCQGDAPAIRGRSPRYEGMVTALPLVTRRPGGGRIGNASAGVSWQHFAARVRATADALPDRPYVLLLAADRLAFLTGFCAALLRGQTALMPAHESMSALTELAAKYRNCYALTDEAKTLPLESLVLDTGESLSDDGDALPDIGAEQIAAVFHTSGSTGTPRAHAKTWAELVACARRWIERLSFGPSDRIVATVAPQHMYGFETTVLLPLQSGAQVYRGRPLYPVDVASALAGLAPATLVTTPVHLAACVRADLEWPRLTRIITSTDRLDAGLARAAEECFAAEVVEIYGATETGAVASRQPARESRWTCLPGLVVRPDGTRAHFVDPDGRSVSAGDILEIDTPVQFRLCGRPADLVKVAGKRASLQDLNGHLTEIDGVIDGVIAMPDDAGPLQRPFAVVVAPGLTAHDIRAALASRIDAAFLPRRIGFVDRLPRDANGKLSVRALRELAAAKFSP